MKIRYCFAICFLLLLLTACNSTPEGEITIHYGDNAQFELIDLEGNRVLIDVHNPNILSTPATETDILLTTHSHPDHVNSGFLSEFPGEQLYIQTGEIAQTGVSIRGIASTHTAYASDEFQDENGTNYIYIIEIGGMRIAHFGDIGQEELTPDQLEALGEVDIALMQFVNSFSQMDMNNEKGFNLMEQVNPYLIIPTHGNGNMDAIGYADELWDTYASTQNHLTIRKADLVEGTKFVIVGAAASSMQAIYDLSDWEVE
jgi:L-ascorbate metabolism protein UlaG (beta-lactamase superfamily)